MEGEGPGLADAFRAAREEPGMVVCQEARAVDGARLLVRGVRDDDVPAGAHALPGPATDHREDHRVHVLHVDRATAPHDTVADLAGERVHGPVVGLGRYDVEMPVDQQRVGRRIGALDPRHHIGPPGGTFQEGRLDTRVGQPLGDVLRGGPLPAVPAAAVGGVDTDQLRGEAHHLVERHAVRGRRVRCCRAGRRRLR